MSDIYLSELFIEPFVKSVEIIMERSKDLEKTYWNDKERNTISLQLPRGQGNSTLIARIVDKFEDKGILIVVPNLDVGKRLKEKFSKDKPFKNVKITSPKSINSARGIIHDIIIFDVVPMYSDAEIKEFYQTFPFAKCYVKIG